MLLNISSKATYNRKYQPLAINSQVRAYVKPKTLKKGPVSVWLKGEFEIMVFKDNQYLINHRHHVWNRWGLLKVDAAEGKGF